MGGSRCIGAIAADGKSIRLVPANGAGKWPAATQVPVGSTWDVVLAPVPPMLKAPHVEDRILISGKHVSQVPDLSSHIRARCTPWIGGMGALFGGAIKYTQSNNGYIAQSNIPDRSTWFWIPDKALVLRSDGKHYDYPQGLFGNFTVPRGLTYVGELAPMASIPAGTLIRVSLARWWHPESIPDMEDRCYLQLSGWY